VNKQIKANSGKNCTHRGDNRQRLIDTNYTVLSGKDIEATTVKEIARITAASPSLFHYYFSSKNELLFAVLQEAGKRFKQHFIEAIHTTTLPSLLDFADVAIGLLKEVHQMEITWYRFVTSSLVTVF
jgi:AcrR family transcriptional regulator